MYYVCILCHREQPIGLGARMDSGSYRCTDTDDCYKECLSIHTVATP
jgi:hypothetical protein